MTSKQWVYWVTTVLVALVMSISGVMALIHAPALMRELAHLGYPNYFSNLLGAAKTTGVVVLLVPGVPRLKEWAYVGFGITVLSAVYSHLLTGAGAMALDPLITFAALALSYWARPEDRRFFPALATSRNLATNRSAR